MSKDLTFLEAELSFIEDLRIGRIASVDLNDAFPHVVPICFVFDGKTFYTTLHKNSKRIKNIENGSKVSFLLDKYEEVDGAWIILRGILIKVKISIFNFFDNRKKFMLAWSLLINKYPQYKEWAIDNDFIPKDSNARRIMQLIPLNYISWGF